MALGRIFPLRNPLRSFPYEPETNGENYRDAPLPFQLGTGGSSNIETTFVVTPLLTITISAILDPNNPGGGGGGAGAGGEVICNPITNQYCVPLGTITQVAAPTGTIRCSIT